MTTPKQKTRNMLIAWFMAFGMLAGTIYFGWNHAPAPMIDKPLIVGIDTLEETVLCDGNDNCAIRFVPAEKMPDTLLNGGEIKP